MVIQDPELNARMKATQAEKKREYRARLKAAQQLALLAENSAGEQILPDRSSECWTSNLPVVTCEANFHLRTMEQVLRRLIANSEVIIW